MQPEIMLNTIKKLLGYAESNSEDTGYRTDLSKTMVEPVIVRESKDSLELRMMYAAHQK